jgi:RNA polymerase sigma factor (sigma-70 family)
LSRGSSSAVLAPDADAGGESPADSDQRLVAAVRQGDDRAFEALYSRYQRRIHAYVLGMVKDHGRAEDVTQEVFVSALRRMRATERPIAFKPWVYEIAKNACIDAFRRSRRAEEVSYDAEEGLAPADHSRLASPAPGPEAAVSAKHDLETLCGAFGGLSESHHRILVLRELEGLSYDEIGARMGMTRPAVESTLFRARRRLSEEYEELISGERCMRVQTIIVAAAEGAVGVRDSRRLARHLAHCQPCRREALAAGLDRGLLVRRPAAERAARRVAAFLPLPAFLRLRRGVSDAAVSGTDPVSRAALHLPALSDQPWGRTAAGIAILLAGVGTGVGVHHSGGGHPGGASRPASVTPVAHRTQSSSAASAATPGASVTAPATSSRSGGAQGDERRRSSSSSPSHGGELQRQGSASGRATSPGGGSSASTSPSGGTPSSTPASGASSSSGDKKASNPGHGGGSSGNGGGSGSGSGSGAPEPSPTPDPVGAAVQQTNQAAQQTVDNAADAVDKTVHSTTGALQNTTQQVTDGVDNTVGQATGGGPVGDTVHNAGSTVNDVVGAAGQTVDQVADGATNTVKGLTNGLLGGQQPTG